MKLERFWVGNYRSIKDSGWIETGQRTVFVGRNESGKSNLMFALRTLKPATELDRLSATRDFPADLPRSLFSPELDVVRTVWSFDESERHELAELLPDAHKITEVEVGRRYEGDCWVRFHGLSAVGETPESIPPTAPPTPTVSHAAQPTVQAVVTPKLENGANAEDLLEPFTPTTDVDLPGATSVGHGPEADKAARDWVVEKLPTFLFLDEYPEIEGHQNLCDFLRRQKEGDPLPSDGYFEKLLITADLDPEAIDVLLTADPDSRRLLVANAGRVVTKRLREIWSDRALRVRFDLDGEHFHTLVSDPNSLYDVEVNLNSRSRGFRWFFSFYVTFAAAAKAGENNTILLLDEPGLHLHPLGQRDLLNHLAEFDNQVMLTTQSPFMVPSVTPEQVRTVSISEEDGTTVSNTPAGCAKTLFPINHVLGAQVARSLFGEGPGLVVEEITDFWYVRAISNFVAGRGGHALPAELTIYPAGGAATVLHMLDLLQAGSTPTIVLRGDVDPATMHPHSSQAVFVSEALEGAPHPLNIEDLLGARAFDRLVRIAHKSQLEGVELVVDQSIPGVVPRYTKAFAQHGLVFSRSRVARVFLHAMAQNPDAVLPEESRQPFERLFATIRERLAAHLQHAG